MASPRHSCLALLLALLAASAVQLSTARDECYGPIVELEVSSQPSAVGSPTRVQQYYGVLADVGSNLSQPLTGLRIAAAEPLTACGDVAPVPPGSALLVIRGNCTFTDKLLAVQAAGGAAMLLYDNKDGCVTMFFDPNATGPVAPSLAAVSIPYSVGLHLADMLVAAARPPPLAAATAAGGGGGGAAAVSLSLSLRLVDPPLVDTGAALLWVLAVGTVAAGAVWSGADHLAAGRAAEEEDQDPLLRSSAGKALGAAGTETVELTPGAALVFVAVASAMLLLLYFLLNRVFFFVLLGLFCLASVQSQTVLYAAGLRAVLPRRARQATLPLPFAGPCPLAVVVALPVAVAVAVVWAVWRNTWSWSWVLQDLQGVALMLLVLRSLRVPSLKVAAVLLPACLAYDVFWVFIQPMLFGGGQSVMVEVAQGGSSGEFVPMLLRVPHFGFGGLGGFSLLGFGDVILPGLLVAYTRRVDLDLGLRCFDGSSGGCGGGWSHLLSYLHRSYFPYSVLSYGAGLCLTYAALAFSWFGDQGQPALLYLVPCTLLTVVGLAAARRQVAALWRGETHGSAGAGRRRPTDHDSDAGDAAAGAGGATSCLPRR